MSQIVTGEAVALDLRPAALPSRVVAGFLDALVQGLAMFVVFALVGAVSMRVSDAAAAALAIVFLVLVLVGYPVAFETLLRGRTLGKAAMGLRVVRDDGGPIGFRQALVRGLTGVFVERPGLTFFLAGVVTMLLNSRGKRLGDLLAGTVVLQERVPARGGSVAVMPPHLAAWAAGLDLSGLPDDLALQSRQFLARSSQLTRQAREDLGGRLVAAVSAAVSPPPPSGTPGWAVLAAVLAERRRREELRWAAAVPVVAEGQHGPRPAAGASAPASAASAEPAGAPSPHAEPQPQAGDTGPPVTRDATSGGFVAPG